jgi:hypothetical protein
VVWVWFSTSGSLKRFSEWVPLHPEDFANLKKADTDFPAKTAGFVDPY